MGSKVEKEGVVMNGLTFDELDVAMRQHYLEVIGKTITNVRIMTEDERNSWGWDGGHWPMVFELSDGTHLIPSMDDEGNGPGNLFLVDNVDQGGWDE